MRAFFIFALLCGSVHAQMLQSITNAQAAASGGNPWTLIAHTQLVPSAITGGTTSAINCTGAKLITLAVNYYFVSSSPPTLSVTDSSGNTYSTGYDTGTAGGNDSRTLLLYAISPTVSSSMTFSLGSIGGLNGVYGSISAQCWNDSSGTPTFQAGNGARGGVVTTIQPGSLTPSVNNSLIVTAFANDTAGTGLTPSIDSGFTNPFPDYVDASVGINIQGGTTYLLQSTAGAVNPTITPGAAPVDNIAAAIMVFNP